MHNVENEFDEEKDTYDDDDEDDDDDDDDDDGDDDDLKAQYKFHHESPARFVDVLRVRKDVLGKVAVSLRFLFGQC